MDNLINSLFIKIHGTEYVLARLEKAVVSGIMEQTQSHDAK